MTGAILARLMTMVLAWLRIVATGIGGTHQHMIAACRQRRVAPTFSVFPSMVNLPLSASLLPLPSAS